MSADDKFLQISRVLKSNGTEGELLLGFRDFGPEDIDLEEPVFVFFDGLPVPYFIEKFEIRGRRALARLTGVRSLRDAEELVGADVYGSAEIYGLEEEDAPDLTGWTLLDADGVRIGVITDYEDIPGNPCIYVETDGGEVLVPLNEDLILSIDEEAGTISMTIPDGLI